jgi:hypothetical protein
MKNKKTLISVAVSAGVIFLLSPSLVSAIEFRGINKIQMVPVTPTPTATPAFLTLPKRVVMPVFKYTNKRAELKNVKVTAKDATSITVDNAGVGVKVTVQSNTHFRRRFWGKSSIAEISVGDSVDIVGRWTSEAKTEIKAVLIRDLSIQKRFGVFFGTVKTMTDTGFILTTIQRGEETVTLDSAKLINRKGQSITASDIQVGHKIRVRGLWDSANFTITEVTEVKDFSLPPFATPTPTP